MGITDVYLGVNIKSTKFKVYLEEKRVHATNVLYMGDDIPDISVMKLAGLPTCPADAVEEIKALSAYVSPYPGGKGSARDVIEKVLKIQGKWMSEEAYSW